MYQKALIKRSAKRPGIRLWRRYPHPAPDKRACRSSSGVCEPDSVAPRRTEPFQIQSLHRQKKKQRTPHGVSRIGDFMPGIRFQRRYLAFHDASRAGIGQKGGYVNRTPLRQGARNRFELGLCPAKNKKPTTRVGFCFWRCRPDLNRRITVLQTGALPLGYCTRCLIAPIL